jgi:hypothetical protein
MPKTKPPKTEINQGEKNKINQKEKTIVEEKLQEINKKLEKKESPLTFEDIEFIVQYTKKHINNEEILTKILNILDEDIKLRKEKFKIDCVNELYNGEEFFPEELRLEKPKENNKPALIKEKLIAIILDNYKREYDEFITEYINKKITYRKYESKTDKLSTNTFSILLKL